MRRACTLAPTAAARTHSTGELGATLLQARRLNEAAETLQQAHGLSQGKQRSRVSLDLGNLANLRDDGDSARKFYQEALQLADGDVQIAYPARLNLARLASPEQRLTELDRLAQDIAGLPDTAPKALWQINLGQQNHLAGPARLAQAFQLFADASRSGAAKLDPALHAEALDSLAQLYEEQGRTDEALRLTRQAASVIAGLPAGSVGDRFDSNGGWLG